MYPAPWPYALYNRVCYIELSTLTSYACTCKVLVVLLIFWSQAC